MSEAFLAGLVFAGLALVWANASLTRAGAGAALAIAAALIASLLPRPPGADEIAFGASLAVVALCAGAVFISFERSHTFVIVSSLLGGGLAGFVMGAMAESPAFYAAMSPLLLAAPARFLSVRGLSIALKIAASWLIAVAILNMAAMVAPPRAPIIADHME
jgi:hypothetical protein